jgi:DNA (cytosine-5)-methyltransferase 1
MKPGLIVDLFAGGGGASVGLEAATGQTVDIAINHSATALAVHQANHPRTDHLTADIWEVQPRTATGGRPVWLLWASPDCTHFSVAKGGKPREQNIRSLAWAVVRWAEEVRPSVILLENVAEFQGWGPLDANGKPVKARMGETFRQWKGKLEELGYVVDHRVLDASLYGAPTRRRRLFLVARCDGQPIHWPEATHGPGRTPLHTAAECIDWSLQCPSIFGRKRPLADKTLARIALGIRKYVLESPAPFVVGNLAPTLIQTGYGERPGQAPRTLDLHEPLGTVVAGGSKHALVAAFLAKHYGGNTTPGSSLARPFDTITTQDHHALVTVATAGHRVPEVRAFLTAYYGSESEGGQALDEPMRTLTTRHRLGLVTVAGVEYQIADIGMRMLEPHELLRAQFGRFAADYDLSAAKTKSAQVRLIGNSVCPEVAEALVAANLNTAAREAA